MTTGDESLLARMYKLAVEWERQAATIYDAAMDMDEDHTHRARLEADAEGLVVSVRELRHELARWQVETIGEVSPVVSRKRRPARGDGPAK